MTTFPGMLPAPNLELTTQSTFGLLPLSYLFTLLHLLSAHWVTGSSLTETNRQQTGAVEESGQIRGRARAQDGLASESSSNLVPIETRSSSKCAEAELDIIDSYASPSQKSESHADTHPILLNSQHGCGLPNEEDYVVEELSDCGDDDWDQCEIYSTHG